MSPPAHAAAIVVAWNSAEHLAACLDSLESQRYEPFEIIVVDNASSDATPQLLAAAASRPGFAHRLTVVTNDTNRGFTGGVNDAIAQLGPRVSVVVLVNPDVVAQPSTVARLVESLQADPRRGSVQPKLIRTVRAPDGAPVLDTTGHVFTTARSFANRGAGERDAGQYDTPGEIFGASGALVAHRRAMLDDVAWRRCDRLEHLTEDLVAYFDDVELDWRARLRGWTAWYEPSIVAEHERGGAAARRPPRVEELNLANRLLVVATCDDTAALLRAAPLFAATTLLKLAEVAVATPAALGPALGRVLRLLPAARRRRAQLRARATLPLSAVPARYAQRFRWGAWVTSWWARVTGRGLGVPPRR